MRLLSGAILLLGPNQQDGSAESFHGRSFDFGENVSDNTIIKCRATPIGLSQNS